jgi:hypothetical protein
MSALTAMVHARRGIMTRAATAILLASLSSLGVPGCRTYQVRTFTADQPLICPGQVTTIRWTVDGPAHLRAERGPDDWDEEDVPSEGERSFAATVSTTFTITAKNANPAKGAFKIQPVGIVAAGYKGEAATCAPSGICTATFTPTAVGPRVRRLSAPLAVVSGRQQPTSLCVTHQGLPRTCIDADTGIDVDVAFEGPWTLETKSADPDAVPPQRLQVQFDFVCH